MATPVWSEEATPHPIPGPCVVPASQNHTRCLCLVQILPLVDTRANSAAGKAGLASSRRGLLISKHRWERGGQRLEQCQHTGSIWGLFVTLLLLLLLWLSFGPFEYQAACKNFCRLVACERWDCVIGASVNREELRCSPKHPFSPWWSAGVVPNGSLPVAKSFIPKPLLFHQDHLVLAQHISILLGAAFYSAF